MNMNKLKSMVTVCDIQRARRVHRIIKTMPTKLRLFGHVYQVLAILALGQHIYWLSFFVSQYVYGIYGSAINLGAQTLITIFHVWVMAVFYDTVEDYGRFKS